MRIEGSTEVEGNLIFKSHVFLKDRIQMFVGKIFQRTNVKQTVNNSFNSIVNRKFLVLSLLLYCNSLKLLSFEQKTELHDASHELFTHLTFCKVLSIFHI